MRTRTATLFAFGGFCLLLAGCGGGGNPPALPDGTGRAILHIVWPQRGKLIPVASNAIKVIFQRGPDLLASQTLPRPASGNQTTATFNNLKVGNLMLTAAAYPNADATGIAQALGTVLVPLQNGQTVNITLTMNSTINHLEVAPSSASPSVGQTVQLTMTAKDSFGNVVLTSPSKMTWVSGNPVVASVDAAGKVTALAVGMATITVTETESGKSATAIVTVQ